MKKQDKFGRMEHGKQTLKKICMYIGWKIVNNESESKFGAITNPRETNPRQTNSRHDEP